MAHPAVKGACRYVLAAVFLMAAVTKITDLQGFADRILLHSGLPPWIGLPVVWMLPWLELVCGLCLVLGYAVHEAATIAILLLVAFLGYALTHDAERDCGCFLFFSAAPSTPVGWQIVRNILLLLCAVRTALK